MLGKRTALFRWKTAKEIAEHCNLVLEKLDEEFPNQKYYVGIVRDLYRLFENIKECARRGEKDEKRIDWNSLVRQFVDETTDYRSPILAEMGILEKLMGQ